MAKKFAESEESTNFNFNEPFRDPKFSFYMNVLSIIIAQYGNAYQMRSFTDLGMSFH